MKECSKCRCPWPRTRQYFAEDKPRPATRKHNRDGLQSHCRACQRETSRNWAADHRERARESTARWHAANRDRNAENFRRWSDEHPQAFDARLAVFRAVQAGRLVWAGTCELCGGNGRMHHHHQDYTRRLDVIPLCRACHRTVHGHLNRGEPDGLQKVRLRQRQAEGPIKSDLSHHQESLDFGTNA
jgi:ribosomal protein L34E